MRISGRSLRALSQASSRVNGGLRLEGYVDDPDRLVQRPDQDVVQARRPEGSKVSRDEKPLSAVFQPYLCLEKVVLRDHAGGIEVLSIFEVPVEPFHFLLRHGDQPLRFEEVEIDPRELEGGEVADAGSIGLLVGEHLLALAIPGEGPPKIKERLLDGCAVGPEIVGDLRDKYLLRGLADDKARQPVGRAGGDDGSDGGRNPHDLIGKGRMRGRSVDAREEAGARNAHVRRCYVLFLLRDLYVMADGDYFLETLCEGDDVGRRRPVGRRGRGGLRPGRAGKTDEEGKGQYRNSHGVLHFGDLFRQGYSNLGTRPATTHHSHILDTSARLHRKDGFS